MGIEVQTVDRQFAKGVDRKPKVLGLTVRGVD